jgi:hypothetical protein
MFFGCWVVLGLSLLFSGSQVFAADLSSSEFDQKVVANLSASILNGVARPRSGHANDGCEWFDHVWRALVPVASQKGFSADATKAIEKLLNELPRGTLHSAQRKWAKLL